MPIRFGSESDLQEVTKLVSACKLSTEYLGQDSPLLVTERDGLIVATMALPRRDNRVHIQSLSVHPYFRRQGLAREIIDHGFNMLQPGDELVALTLFWNKEFYFKVGFEMADAAAMKKADDIGQRKKHRHCMALIRRRY